jgi:HlyD family secretion protein
MDMGNKKRLILGGAILASVAVAAWATFQGQGSTEYRTVPVQRGDVTYTVSATGTPNAVVTVQVGSQVSGNILALYADFNTKVKKGQLVAKIDPQIFQARVDQAQAALNSAQSSVVSAQAQIQKSRADLASSQSAVASAQAGVSKAQSVANDAKAKLDRRVTMFNEGITSKEDQDTARTTYDQAVAEMEAARAQVKAAQDGVNAAQAQVRVSQTLDTTAQAQVKQAQASLIQAQADLEHTNIVAPVDGVVVARHIDVGQTVAASLQAPTLFEIAEDLTKMQVDTNVSEADVGRVDVGMPATFTVDAYPGEVFTGSVNAIRKAPINVQNVITYDVVVSFSNADMKLFPGMTANVKIQVEKHPDVLKISNAALRFRPADAPAASAAQSGGRGNGGGRGGNGRAAANANNQVLWLLGQNGKPQAVPVVLGISDGVSTEVASGDVRQGDPVIVAALGKKERAGQTSPLPGGGRRGPGF